jgi:hypothetical protein
MTNEELKYRLEKVREYFNADLRICRSSDFDQVAIDQGIYVHSDLARMNIVMVTTDYTYSSLNCTIGEMMIEGWLVFVTKPVLDSLEFMSKVVTATQQLFDGQIDINTCLFELPAELAIEHQFNVSVVSLRVMLRSDLLDSHCYKICYE